ncbi:MAG: CPBP family glutamic-type intramembrane protease [Candidatus Sigynarchaeota archaeon]
MEGVQAASQENRAPPPHQPGPRVLNTAGAWVQETKGRAWNLAEPVLLMSLLQVLMWGVWYPLELAGESPTVAYVLIGCLAIAIFVSPFIHRDTINGWGLGNPMYVFKKIRSGGKPRVIALFVVCLFLVIGAVAFYFLWEEIADALFNMSSADAASFLASPGGTLGVIGLGMVAGFFVATFLIRYDNFLNALKVALVVIVALGVPLFLTGIALDPSGLDRFDLGNFALNFAGYIFWGALQQFLFAGYFGMRFQKAFGPAVEAKEPGNPTKQEARGMYVKRFWVSLLAGSYFGLIHVPSWYLVGFTWLLGVILSWLYMKDKNRNLLALGIIHGCLGALANVFFESNVSFSVGPSTGYAIAIAPVFWIVGIVLALHEAIIVLAWWVSDGRKQQK